MNSSFLIVEIMIFPYDSQTVHCEGLARSGDAQDRWHTVEPRKIEYMNGFIAITSTVIWISK